MTGSSLIVESQRRIREREWSRFAFISNGIAEPRLARSSHSDNDGKFWHEILPVLLEPSLVAAADQQSNVGVMQLMAWLLKDDVFGRYRGLGHSTQLLTQWSRIYHMVQNAPTCPSPVRVPPGVREVPG